jgi:ABC-type phosphate/phosphonate transport system substrate-binding protein
MIATLPMYLRPETREATEAFWAGIRDRLRDAGIPAPDTLDHTIPPAEAWGRSDLVLSQICNLPWRIGFADRVTLVALPDLGLPGTRPGDYHSVLIARTDDRRETLAEFAGATIALNAADSQSGWGSPAAAATRAGIEFGRGLVTGAHAESARAVAENRADLAAIDAATWRMIRRWDPFAARLRVFARTPPTPALAYITAGRKDPAPYRAALEGALDALPGETRGLIGLAGLVAPDPDAYSALSVPPAPPE